MGARILEPVAKHDVANLKPFAIVVTITLGSGYEQLGSRRRGTQGIRLDTVHIPPAAPLGTEIQSPGHAAAPSPRWLASRGHDHCNSWDRSSGDVSAAANVSHRYPQRKVRSKRLRKNAAAPVFLNRRLDRIFKRRGWVVVSAWEPQAVERLVALHHRFGDHDAQGYHVTTASPDFAYRRAVAEEIGQTFAPAISSMLIDYEPYSPALVLKEARGDSMVWAHQDGTCNDEDGRPGIVAWIPATPVDEHAGYLRGLWGSHRYMPGIRSTPPTASPFQAVRDELLVQEMPQINVGLGQALLFDSRLVHGSEPNRSGKLRVAGYLRFHPAGSTALNFWWDQDANVVHGYEVDHDFFLTHVWDRPPDRPCFTTFVPEEPQQMTLADIRRLRRWSRIRPVRWDRLRT